MANKTKSLASSKKFNNQVQWQPFLHNILTNLLIRQAILDSRAMILLGINCLIFILSLGALVSKGIQGGTISSLTICSCSLVSAIFCLCELSPPEIFISRKNNKESVMHHSNINSFTLKQFNELLKKIALNNESMFEHYSRAIYNITTKSVMKKKYFIAIAGYFLILGLVLGLLLAFNTP
jgi:hypothetical protein